MINDQFQFEPYFVENRCFLEGKKKLYFAEKGLPRINNLAIKLLDLIVYCEFVKSQLTVCIRMLLF